MKGEWETETHTVVERTERILGDANGITDEETRIKYLEEKSQEITRVLVVTEERLQKIEGLKIQQQEQILALKRTLRENEIKLDTEKDAMDGDTKVVVVSQKRVEFGRQAIRECLRSIERVLDEFDGKGVSECDDLAQIAEQIHGKGVSECDDLAQIAEQIRARITDIKARVNVKTAERSNALEDVSMMEDPNEKVK